MCEELCGRGRLPVGPSLLRWCWGDRKPSPWLGDITGVTSVLGSATALVLLMSGVSEDDTTATQKTHSKENEYIFKKRKKYILVEVHFNLFSTK